MTNENLKIEQPPDVTLKFLELLSQETREHIHTPRCIFQAARQGVKLIKSQQSRIEVLESAIREFLSWTCYKDDEPDYLDALQTLRNLMENKS